MSNPVPQTAIAALCTITLLAFGSLEARAQQAPYVPGELLVKFRPGVTDAAAEAIARGVGAVRTGRLLDVPARHNPWIAERIGNLRHLYLGAGASVPAAVRALRGHPAVEYAEPNYIVTKKAHIEDDALFDELWGLHNEGQTGGAADADIDAPEAWHHPSSPATGAGIVVAVLDTGVDYTHPDLADNIWINPGEIPANGVDDDGNGFVDDIHGWDFYSNDSDPMDVDDHGSHISGTIAGVDNTIGVKGVAHGARIMALRFVGPNGGTTSDAIFSLVYAVANGAQVTSNSWGSGGFSQAMLDAILLANDAGVLFIAAAGNEGSNNDQTPFYPAGYDAPNVIAVAATTHTDALAGVSNYGAESVDLGAPGEAILSTILGSGYDWRTGTSTATPHVAGASALVHELAPGLTPVQVREVVLFTGDPKPSLDGITKSGARLNAAGAVELVGSGASAIRTRPADGFSVGSGAGFDLEALVYPHTGAQVIATLGGTPTALTDDFDGGEPSDFVYGATLTAPSNSGDFQIHVEARDDDGDLLVDTTITGTVGGAYLVEETGFEWIDISSSGAAHALGDDDFVAVPLGFAFRFLGTDWSEVHVNSNGFLTFGWGSTEYSNEDLSTTSLHNLICPWWDDISPPKAGTIYTHTMGAEGDRIFVASFVGVAHFNLSSSNRVSFQAVLHEATSEIRFNYLDATFGNSSYDSGASATIGVKGGPVTQWSFNSASVVDGTSLRFHLPEPGLLASLCAGAVTLLVLRRRRMPRPGSGAA